jgi:RNA polymerase sigma factor (sigma-70 family)
MASSSQFGVVVREVSRLFRVGTVAGFSEGQLLDRFVTSRDEAAFEALLARHGPMVLGVCRRVLDDPSDVEDAFQATFLILVKKAASLRNRDLLANWLYGVALKVARRARKTASRRRAREKTERTEAVMPGPGVGNGVDEPGELRAILDDEIARLPEKFRTPVLLCYLQGLTHDQAAERIACPVGTVRSRLAKARDVLQGRLTRRGAAPSAGLLATDRLLGACPEVPYALLQSTIKAASQLATGQALAAGTVSTSTCVLMKGAMNAMTIQKCLTVVTAASTLGLATVGGSLLAAQESGRGSGSSASQTREQDRDELIKSLRQELREARQRIAAQTRQIDILSERLDQLQETASGATSGTRPASLGNKADGASSTGGAGSGNPGAGSMTSSSSINQPIGSAQGAMARGMMGGGMASMSGPAMSAGAAGNGAMGMAGMSGSGAMAMPGMMGGMGGGSMPGMGGNRSMGMAGMGMVGMGGGSTSNAGTTTKGSGTGKSPFLEGPNQTIITTSAAGDRVVVHHLGSQSTKAFKVSSGERITPICSENILALAVAGPEISRIAVYDFEKPEWNAIELKEPLKDGKAIPILTGDAAFYKIGHRVYAYSPQAKRWDVLNLKDDSAQSVWYGGRKAAFLMEDHLHIFNVESGKWEDVDLK